LISLGEGMGLPAVQSLSWSLSGRIKVQRSHAVTVKPPLAVRLSFKDATPARWMIGRWPTLLLWLNILYLEHVVTKQAIHTPDAPLAIGTYSQAIRVGAVVYLSGQIGLDPSTMQLVDGFDAQAHRVFLNLRAVAAAAGLNLDDAVKMTVFVTDLANFARLNEIMAHYLKQPYPSRSAVGVAQLPRGALLEIEAVLVQS
jgi:reactive intermediate/imine deaminase